MKVIDKYSRENITRQYIPFTPAPIREAQPERNVPAEPERDEPVRRFATYTDTEAGAFVIRELEPTTRPPINWTDGATTREGAWKQAQSQARPVVWVQLSGEQVTIGVVFDQAVADEVHHATYVAREASFSDAAFYAGPTLESWVAQGRPSHDGGHHVAGSDEICRGLGVSHKSGARHCDRCVKPGHRGDKVRLEMMEAGVPDDDRALIALEANRETNMCGGIHSDALRAHWERYKRDGADKFKADFDKTREMSHFK